MFRALHERKEHNARFDPEIELEPIVRPGLPVPDPQPTPAPRPLASFRAGDFPAAPERPSPPPLDLDPAQGPLEPRKKRPDLRKLDRQLARNQR